MIEIIENEQKKLARIAVIGVGGAGNSVVKRMHKDNITEIELIRVNTDEKALINCPDKAIQIGVNVTKGLGAGAKPEIGKHAAEESIEEIKQAVEGLDLAIVTCGMGGGTGTGAGPVISRICKELGILTIGIVTKPFSFEGNVRMQNAIAGIEEMNNSVDTLLVIPNDKLLNMKDKKIRFKQALEKTDDVLRQTVQSILDIINVVSDINIDFEDFRTVINGRGKAYIGIGTGEGENKALEAVKESLMSPLLDTSVNSASDMILSISGDITLYEAAKIASTVNNNNELEANVIFGFKYNEEEKDKCKVTVIATGLK